MHLQVHNTHDTHFGEGENVHIFLQAEFMFIITFLNLCVTRPSSLFRCEVSRRSQRCCDGGVDREEYDQEEGGKCQSQFVFNLYGPSQN